MLLESGRALVAVVGIALVLSTDSVHSPSTLVQQEKLNSKPLALPTFHFLLQAIAL